MVRLGTWNVENLFLPGSEGGPKTDADYHAKLASLAAVITQWAPAVLAVQEIGSPSALRDLANEIGGEWEIELAAPDQREIRVGVLSRLPLADVRQVTTFPAGVGPIRVDDAGTEINEMGRPALQVRVEADGRVIDIVACHLKSKLLSYPNGRFAPRDENERARYGVFALTRRAAEAAAVRERATQLLAGKGQERAVVVLGDLNDEPSAATTQILLGPTGSEIGTGGYDTPDLGDGQRLWNLAPRIPADKRFSRIYRGQKELIDHMLVSHAVAQLVRDGDITTGDTALLSIDDNPLDRVGRPGSDHRPVFVDIAF